MIQPHASGPTEHKWPKQKSAAKIPPATPHHRPPNNLLEREAARPGLDDGARTSAPPPGGAPPRARETPLSPGAGEA